MGVSAWAIAPKEQGLSGLTNLPAENLVRSRGLEPPRLAALAPQASASASSATTALTSIVKTNDAACQMNGAKARKEDVGVKPRPKMPALRRLAKAFSAALGLAAKGS